MAHRLIQTLTALSIVLFLGLTWIWIQSNYVSTYLVWTSGTTLYNVNFEKGMIMVVRFHRWWRYEPLDYVLDSIPLNAPPTPIKEYPGMYIER